VIYEDWVKFIFHNAQSAVKSAFSRGMWEWLPSSHSLPTAIESFPFPFPLVAQNYPYSYGNLMGTPWEWEFPLPCTPLALYPFSEDQQRWLEAHGDSHGMFQLTVSSVAWDRMRNLYLNDG